MIVASSYALMQTIISESRTDRNSITDADIEK